MPSDDIINKVNEISCDDWRRFEVDAELPAHVSEKMLRNIFSQTLRVSRLRKRFASVITAAACLMLTVAGIRYLVADLEEKTVTKQSLITSANVIKNEHESKRLITLTDGSSVILYPGSSLEIANGFNTTSRELRLNGEAKFSVARNPHKPFRVLSGTYSTTALGTSFTVKYCEGDKQLNVKLQTGKVSVQEHLLNGTNDTLCYLQPNEAVTVDLTNKRFALSTITRGSEIARKQPISKAHRTLRPKHEALYIDRESLPGLLDRLSRQYDTAIEYQQEDIDHINVTATFKGESLEAILSEISLLNGLSCEWQRDRFIIRRAAPR